MSFSKQKMTRSYKNQQSLPNAILQQGLHKFPKAAPWTLNPFFHCWYTQWKASLSSSFLNCIATPLEYDVWFKNSTVKRYNYIAVHHWIKQENNAPCSVHTSHEHKHHYSGQSNIKKEKKKHRMQQDHNTNSLKLKSSKHRKKSIEF